MPCSLHFGRLISKQRRLTTANRGQLQLSAILAPMLPWPTLTLVLDIAPRVDPCESCPRIWLLSRQRAGGRACVRERLGCKSADGAARRKVKVLVG
jgi:hypothetical protein